MRNGHTKRPCEQMHTKRKAATITEVTINVLEQLEPESFLWTPTGVKENNILECVLYIDKMTNALRWHQALCSLTGSHH